MQILRASRPRTFVRLAAGTAIAAVMAHTPISGAKAGVTYTYTGNDFISYSSGPFSPTDAVTASITLADPLGDSLDQSAVTPISFTIGDGVSTITNATATSATILFSTDGDGDIDGWTISVGLVSAKIGIGSFDNSPYSGEPTLPTYDIGCTNISDGYCTAADQGYVLTDPGTWAATVDAVPEPASLALMAVSVLGSGFVSRRRNRSQPRAQDGPRGAKPIDGGRLVAA